MAITTVLFDLDGTLLPMDQEVFIKDYLGRLSARLADFGYDPREVAQIIWRGTGAMIQNNGQKTNETVFWDNFAEHYGEEARQDEKKFEVFYTEEFDRVQKVCGYEPKAAQVVKRLKEKGLQVALATNPLFPAIATQKRIRWAGLQPEDFAYYTTYENAHFCKPNLDYYREVLEKLDVRAEECLMVGNDVGEDMITQALGMQVFLLTPCLINRKNTDIDRYPHGDMDALLAYIEKL